MEKIGYDEDQQQDYSKPGDDSRLTEGLSQQYYEERHQKQNYLIENIASKGYDTGEFASFLMSRRGIIFE